MEIGTPGLVSVVWPCFNAERFLPDALESVLAQSYGSLEVVAIDDGSTDGTRDILEGAAGGDARVRVLVNEENLGLIRTLNRGVDEARGELIARMDADDRSAPTRLERQVEFLRDHPGTDIVGTAATLIDESDRVVRPHPVRCVSPEGARFMALFAIPTNHATILARADVMSRHRYRVADECLHVEDYDLFARMTAAGVRIANLEEPLYEIRISPQSVSRKFEDLQVEHFVARSKLFLQESLDVEVSDGLHRVLVNRMDASVGGRDLVRGVGYVDWLRDGFLRSSELGRDAEREVRAIAAQQRVDIVIQALKKGRAGVRLMAAALLPTLLPGLFSAPTRRYLAAKLGA